jgi:hypothetical protein
MTQNIDLATITSFQGFSISGANIGDGCGYSASNAGDVNGDNIDDIIIGAPYATGGKDYGMSYVIFGTTNGFSDIDLATLTSTQGFSIYHTSAVYSGWSVSSAGDVNDDGYDDIIIGAPYANYNNGYWAGQSYIIYGGVSFPSSINLASLTSTQGSSIIGVAGSDSVSGYSVSNAGDVNGDGYDDVIIGAPCNPKNNAGSCKGASYVIYGGSPLPATINLASLGTQGFSIFGVSTYTYGGYTGFSVSGIGDINKDGYDDVIVMAPVANCSGTHCVGISYVIYGGSSIPSTISLASLTIAQGFSISGTLSTSTGGNSYSYVGGSVRGAGDVNGDGYNDIIIGYPYIQTSSYSSQTGYITYSNAGISYLIFGNATTFLSNINLASSSQSGWVYIQSYGTNSNSGYSVSGAGDINNDGYDDIIIGAPGVSSYTGISYVIYGEVSFSNIEDLLALTTSQGFLVTDSAGSNNGFSVSGVGDINNDGYSDFITGTIYHDYAYNSLGTSYVIYGSVNPTAAPTIMPSFRPTKVPSQQPTLEPTAPTIAPTIAPMSPTASPTQSPTNPTQFPTVTSTTGQPFKSLSPSFKPSSNTAPGNSNGKTATESAGETAGIVIGVISGVLGLILTCAKIYYFCKKAHANDDKKNLPLNRYFSALDSEDNSKKNLDFAKIRHGILSKNISLDNSIISSLLAHTYTKETDVLSIYSNILLKNNIVSNLVKQAAAMLENNHNSTILIFDEDTNSRYSKLDSAIIIGNHYKDSYITTDLILAHELVHFFLSNQDKRDFNYNDFNRVCKITLIELENYAESLKNTSTITETYFLERMANLSNKEYADETIRNEELAARCVEFIVAGVSSEIIDLCKPIEDLLMQGINNSNIGNEFT